MNDRDRIDELEEKVRQLRDLLRPLGDFPSHWRLTPLESRLLAALCRNGDLNHDAACVVASVDGYEMTSPEVVRQHVSRLRRKLTLRAITIHNQHRTGYYLDPSSLTAARIGFQPAHRVEK